MEVSFYKRWFYFVPVAIHLILIIALTAYTASILDTIILPVYLLLSALFLASTFFSLNTILRFQSGVFYYLLNIMFLLGFWFKYSVQKITSLEYREPIGTFVSTPESEVRVLWVIICGIGGFLLAQICSYYFLNKNVNEVEEKHRFKKLPLVILLVLAIVLAAINLKFNILMLALKPSIILPFKGNAVYFLALTRGIIFLFFYYCFRSYSNKMVFWGAVVACICSVGVLSRMVVLTYFAVGLILILQNISIWGFRKTVKNVFVMTSVFILFSYLTVHVATTLREIYMRAPAQVPSQIKVVPINDVTSSKETITNSITDNSFFKAQYKNIKDELETYKELAMGRWIGMEGVMAVDSYSRKSFAFLFKALKEESYQGVSFYTQISNPEFSTAPNTSQITSTSVPGPIAFFYYSGSLVFVFFTTLVFTFLCSVLEHVVLKLFIKAHAAGIFISTFMVFDFFQFGISPIAFVRYWSFSFFSIAVFYYFTTFKMKKN